MRNKMNTKDLNRIELLTVSILYGITILMLISDGSGSNSYVSMRFKETGISYSYLSNYFLPELFRCSIQYFSFLLLNFCCLPALFRKSNTNLHLSLIVVMFLISGLVISIGNTYSKADELLRYETLDEAYNVFFFNGFTKAAWLILLICIYGGLKELLLDLIENKTTESSHQMKLEITFGAAFWFVGVLVMVVTDVDFDVILCWTFIISACIALTIYNIYFLIPTLVTEQNPFRVYLGKSILLTILISIPFILILIIFERSHGLFAIFIAFHFPAQLLISTPLAWYIYKTRHATEEKISSLKMELGKSDATLGFLKSQINPHFLFNALNTLYGTALQEKADRTGEGIQKLGDMMRFMLQENMQDKISLSRDIDYLNNYIALQQLRTSTAVDITISTEIGEQLTALEITPMLLIPFVENAFKHGISLQFPSHIKITLQTKGNTLYFDVHNSIHLKADGDPEKLNSGIGLQNVKQRLSLLYPKKHELIIRESAKEFFVHLTLTLK